MVFIYSWDDFTNHELSQFAVCSGVFLTKGLAKPRLKRSCKPLIFPRAACRKTAELFRLILGVRTLILWPVMGSHRSLIQIIQLAKTTEESNMWRWWESCSLFDNFSHRKELNEEYQNSQLEESRLSAELPLVASMSLCCGSCKSKVVRRKLSVKVKL